MRYEALKHANTVTEAVALLKRSDFMGKVVDTQANEHWQRGHNPPASEPQIQLNGTRRSRHTPPRATCGTATHS